MCFLVEFGFSVVLLDFCGMGLIGVWGLGLFCVLGVWCWWCDMVLFVFVFGL